MAAVPLPCRLEELILSAVTKEKLTPLYKIEEVGFGD
jgi:hypothetical protein